MLRIFATDYHHDALASDNLATVTTRFDRGAHFHDLPSSYNIEIQRKKTEIAASNPDNSLLYLVCFFVYVRKKDATKSSPKLTHRPVGGQTDATGAMKDAEFTSAFDTPCNAPS